MKRRFLRCGVVVAVGFAVVAQAQAQVRVEGQESGVGARLRGISAVDARVAWASGQQGTVLRTLDGGAHWQAMQVPGAEALDFRDVEAFDAMTAVVLSIGPGASSRVYRTDDGGTTWTLALQNRDERAFFDCMAFDGQRGWMLGDPVDGRFQLYATSSGGRDWTLTSNGPPASEGEAAFAASGTCIARLRGALAVASGGHAARVHVLRDGASAWRTHDAGMDRRKPEAGVFSLAPLGAGWFAVGGDYKGETTPGNAASSTARAVKRGAAPRGYRSGAACVRNALPCIAVGPSGVDAWDGKRWHPASDLGFDAIDLAGNTGWASGADGRIARITVAD